MAAKNLNNITVVKPSSFNFLLTGIVLTTIYFNTEFTDPFNSAKLIIIMVTASWLLGHIINFYLKNDNRVFVKDLQILGIPLAFMVFMAVSLIYTDVFIVGLMGDTQRRNGFLSYLAFIIIFIYTYRAISFGYALKFLNTAVLLGFILSVYGVMQIMGRDFVSWNNPYNAMIVTLGNPNFASSLLAILALVSISTIFIKDRSFFYKIIAIVGVAMSFFCIIESQSRQGLLVLFFGITIYLNLYVFTNKKKFVYVITPLSVVFSLLVFLGMLQKGPLTSYLYKDSVSVRGFYWRAALEMIRDFPLTGVGLDSYGSYFKQFRSVEYPLRYGFEITSSNAHNTVLQLFSTAGIFVGSSYVAILLLIAVAGVRTVVKTTGNEQRIILGLLVAWFGFQSQSLISIDNIGIAVWGWIIGGAILGLSRIETKDTSYVAIKNKSNFKKTADINVFQTLISSSFLIPALILSLNCYRFETDSYLLKSLNNAQSKEYVDEIISINTKIVSNPISDPYYKFQAALALVDNQLLPEAYSQINKLSESDPRNLEYLRWRSLYAFEMNNYVDAIQIRNQIALLDPWNAQNYLELGILYKKTGNIEKMEEIKKKILSFASLDYTAEQARIELM